jgi:hypothetical protein
VTMGAGVPITGSLVGEDARLDAGFEGTDILVSICECFLDGGFVVESSGFPDFGAFGEFNGTFEGVRAAETFVGEATHDDGLEACAVVNGTADSTHWSRELDTSAFIRKPTNSSLHVSPPQSRSFMGDFWEVLRRAFVHVVLVSF